MEQTYVMLKPETLKRGLMGEIINRIEKKGYKIIAMEIMCLNDSIIEQHYGHLKNAPYDAGVFEKVVEQISAGPVLAMIIEGNNVIEGIRKMVGATKEENRVPGTIRFDYSDSTTYNLIHASDSVETAQIEIKRFFPNK